MDYDTIAPVTGEAPRPAGEEIARFLEIWRILAGTGGDPRLAHNKVERWLESLARS